jgi:hypothetical protein
MEGKLEDALAAIQERNKKVEIQKAWETSRTRRSFIACVTYATAFIYMSYGLGEPAQDAFMHAFVPTGGYLLSTFSLPIIKDRWLQWFFTQNP